MPRWGGWRGHFEKRVDPTRLVDGAKSVVSLLHSYAQPEAHAPGDTIGKISRYAWGTDYHDVLKEKLFALFNWLDERTGGSLGGRVFVDSAPVLDKAWAQRAGLGWMGKSTMLLNRQMGSFFFVAELILDLDLAPDDPFTADFCGTCTRCIDACPTDAIYQPYAVDANRCISYLTIENRDAQIPEGLRPDVGNWIFGCDICQDVCPWNKFKRPTSEPRFLARPGVEATELREWAEMDIEEWRRRFRKSPVKRTKFDGFKRNVLSALRTVEERREAEERRED